MNRSALKYLPKAALLASCALATAFAPLATCGTISLTTAASPTIGTTGISFSFLGATVPSSNLSSLPALLSGQSLSDSFGEFLFNTSSANKNVVDLSVTPTVNGKSSTLNFTGDLVATTIGKSTFYSLDFASTVGSHVDDNASTGHVDYTALTFDGYDFAVKTDFQLNTSSRGKGTWVSGYVAPMVSSVPEPLSAATTGLAILALLGIALRRKLRSEELS